VSLVQHFQPKACNSFQPFEFNSFQPFEFNSFQPKVFNYVCFGLQLIALPFLANRTTDSYTSTTFCSCGKSITGSGSGCRTLNLLVTRTT